MIPAHPTQEQLSCYVANIKSAYLACTPDQAARGDHWYETARSIACVLGDGDVRMGAGLLAALSPQRRWERNVSLARDAAAGNVHGQTSAVLAKVRAILEGGDPAQVIPADLKTGHFYRSILDPSDPDPVTVDRHSHDVAAGEVYGSRERGLSSKARYAGIAHSYRVAARELGKIPSAVQAATWCRQTDLLAGTGTRMGVADLSFCASCYSGCHKEKS